MRVKCILSNITVIENTQTLSRLRKSIRLPDGQLKLTVGIEYVVYGITFRDNAPWYYICLDLDDEYPSPYPHECFEVTDSKPSRTWRLGTDVFSNGTVESRLVFPEWAIDQSYYEDLLDGSPSCVDLFSQYREILDNE